MKATNITLKNIQDYFRNHLKKFSSHSVDPINSGFSTEVYKLTKDNTTLYLRFSDRGCNASTEVLAHKKAIERGVKVPKVIYYKDFEKELSGRSFLITEEIKGSPLKESNENTLIEAGKDLALLNSVKVKGIGWINRNEKDVRVLKGKNDNYKDFVLNEVTNHLEYLRKQRVFSKTEFKKLITYYDEHKHLLKEYKAGHLSHGDYGLHHIYSFKNKYSGMIDLGDIRAASIYHDLAHFYVFTQNKQLFKHLLKGFKEVINIPQDYKERINIEGFVFALGKLWWVSKNRPEKLNKNHPGLVFLKNLAL